VALRVSRLADPSEKLAGVIPKAAKRLSGIHNPGQIEAERRRYRFRAPAFGRPRNDDTARSLGRGRLNDGAALAEANAREPLALAMTAEYDLVAVLEETALLSAWQLERLAPA
jgi:hypothetical protein